MWENQNRIQSLGKSIRMLLAHVIFRHCFSRHGHENAQLMCCHFDDVLPSFFSVAFSLFRVCRRSWVSNCSCNQSRRVVRFTRWIRSRTTYSFHFRSKVNGGFSTATLALLDERRSSSYPSSWKVHTMFYTVVDSPRKFQALFSSTVVNLAKLSRWDLTTILGFSLPIFQDFQRPMIHLSIVSKPGNACFRFSGHILL